MSDFILTEADDDEDDVYYSDDDEGNFIQTESDNEFIDDKTVFDEDTSFYNFTNVQKSYDETMQECVENFDFNSEANNYVCDDDLSESIDEFDNFENKIDKFIKTLYFPTVQNENSFLYAVLYAIRYHLTEELNEVSDEFFSSNALDVFEKLYALKDNLKLDLKLSSFENQCFMINQILNQSSLFLRVYEQKKKFRYITNTKKDNKKIIRDISACVSEKFNGFLIVRVDFDCETQKNFTPIDIVYTPVKQKNETVKCFFTDKIHLAFRTTFNEGKKLKHSSTFRCYYCTSFFTRKERFLKHLKICTGKPGYVYNFDTQNILTFEENLKNKIDIPIAAYIDFETTAPTDKMFDPECCKMKPVSYSIIFAFHPSFNFKRVIILRSFGHSLLNLTTINYLTAEQLKYKDEITMKQLRDAALQVHEKINQNAIAEMFSIELKFASDCLLKWFNSKYKKIELPLAEKRNYELQNPIDWENGRCQICTFPIDVKPSISNENNRDKITYCDFTIQKEHKFLRNVLSISELSKSDTIANIESYHRNFRKFLRLCIFAESAMKTLNKIDDCNHEELVDFLNEKLEIEKFSELKEKIAEVNAKSRSKIPQFNIQTYAFFYNEIMKFPKTCFESDSFTTKNLFETVHKIINVKIHLHHSHITGEIKGYTHDFCNWIIKENKDIIPCFAHNFFKFDFYFLLKNLRLSVYRTRDVNIGGNNLTDINFASIDNFKFIDTIKYYQTSLGQLSETTNEIEKKKIRETTLEFITTHDYFSGVWQKLTFEQQEKILEIIINGKGVIPYEKIDTIHSLSIKPEDGIFFSKDEFFSTLKDESVDVTAYENAKKLYILLQMRNLSDLNDLYNVQDVIILLEIIENRFQIIQDKVKYNPRIINSASKLSGCIQREQSKCILALPINANQMEVFEKTVCGGFSAVNNRLAFDTEILMPNLKTSDFNKMSIDESFKAYKRDDLKVVYSFKSGKKNFKKRGLLQRFSKWMRTINMVSQ